MKAEDIIEGLNSHLETKRKELGLKDRGHLVLQRTITSNPVYKIYKTYEAIIWYVKGAKNYRVITVTRQDKVPEGAEELVQRMLNIELCHTIFNWIGSEYYNQVLTGKFKGYREEEDNEITKV